MTKFLNHTRIKTVVGENGNNGKWEILGRITYYPHDGMSPLDVARFSESLWENETLTHLREEKRKRVATKVQPMDIESCMGVFRDLLYTYTMPNNHYCSTHMMACHHLMLRGSPKVYGKTKL